MKMKFKIPVFFVSALIISLLLFTACQKNDDLIIDTGTENPADDIIIDNDPDFEPTDWTTETHSKDADPDFSEVFDNNEVKRLDMVVTAERWGNMLDDMTNLYGSFGVSGGGPGPGGGLVQTDENPIFVPAEVFYNGKQWYRVGIRFKGNSSLQNSWKRGILKLSFKLDFDEFEDNYPQIDNQRFYGFKKLSLKNNYEDKSFLREKVTSEVFANAGLASSHTAFYTLYLDHGDGPEYFGLYTLVEEVDNTVIKTQFSDNDGNLYKPEDTGASFVNGTFNKTDFEKKTNEDEEDWSDIQALFSALHSENRTTDPASWRTNLETVFDTDVFLNYLAVNTVVQNWDTYGRMTHNYYLYNNPDDSKFSWIPWDNNEALQYGKMGGALNLNFSNIQRDAWPLIEYLYADEVYKARYDDFVKETIESSFEINTIQSMYTKYASLIETFATSERTGYTFLNNSSDFQQAISALNQHVTSRTSAVENYLK
ncbi:MAG: spore coat protein [Bacteroidetes bacterium]|nr:spore coat protein [Bacteroidota bacterium]